MLLLELLVLVAHGPALGHHRVIHVDDRTKAVTLALVFQRLLAGLLGIGLTWFVLNGRLLLRLHIELSVARPATKTLVEWRTGRLVHQHGRLCRLLDFIQKRQVVFK